MKYNEESFVDDWNTRKSNKWILDKIKPELYLEAKMTKLRLSYFEHILRRSTIKDNNDGKSRRYLEKWRPKYEMD